MKKDLKYLYHSGRMVGESGGTGGPQVKSLIGVCYENSIGVPQNYAKAVKWLGRRI